MALLPQQWTPAVRTRRAATLLLGPLVGLLLCTAAEGRLGRIQEAAPSAASGIEQVLGVDRETAGQIADQLAIDPFSPAVAAGIGPRLESIVRSRGAALAPLLERPGVSVAYEAGGGKEFLPEVLTGSVKVATDGGGAEFSTPIANYGVSVDPRSRSLSATLAYGAPQRMASWREGGADFVARKVIKVEFTFDNNREFLSALGISAESLPGGRAAMALAGRILNRELLTPEEPVNDPDTARSALDAVRRTLVPNADTFAHAQSVSTSDGYEFTLQAQGMSPKGASGEGSVRFYALNVQRTEREGMEPIRYADVGVGLGLGGGVGKYKASVGVSVSHSSDPGKREANPEARELAQVLRNGDVARAVRAATEKTSLVWDHEAVTSGLRRLLSSPTARAPGADRIAVAPDARAGGVMLFFDPALLETAVAPGDLGAALSRLSAALFAGKDRVAIRVGDGEESFITLSLKQWLAQSPPARTLGRLTRIRGYVVKGDDLVLIGQSVAGRPAMDADVLTAALQTVYRTGNPPFVSLDPDPENPYGPQRVRTGGMPQAVIDSEFGSILLDADYDMKRIGLGELKVRTPGFRSWYDLILESRDAPDGYRRFWLSPLPALAGDVLVSGPVVLFESRVQVQTERMKEAGELLAPSGEVGRQDQDAAEELTTHYEEIESETPSFARLHVAVDAAKLAAILRFRGVKHPLLEQLADRSLRRVSRADGKPISSPYSGIGPKVVGDTFILIGGGALTRTLIRPSSVVESSSISALAKGDASVELPPSIPLAEASQPDLRAGAALTEFGEGRLTECERLATSALEVDPASRSARVYRALARVSLGNPLGARQDLDRVVREEPSLGGLRGLLRLYLGDPGGAKVDTAAAVRAAPHRQAVWEWHGMVCALTLDFPGARTASNRIQELNSLSPAAFRVSTLTHLLSRMSPAAARSRVAQMLAIPIPLNNALAEALAGVRAADGKGGARAAQRAIDLSRRYAELPAVQRYHARERAVALLALAELAGATPEAQADPAALPGVRHADLLISQHPTWPTGYLLKAFCALKLGAAGNRLDPKRLMDQAFSLKQETDPLTEDWGSLFGGSLKATVYASGLLVAMTSRQNPGPYLSALSREPGRTGAFAAAIHKTLRFDKTSEALPILRRSAEIAMRERPRDDPGSLIVHSVLLLLYAYAEQDSGNRPAALRATRSMASSLPTDHPTFEGLSILGALRLLSLSAEVQVLQDTARADSRLANLTGTIAKGVTDDIPRLSERAKSISAAFLAESARQDSGLVSLCLRPSLEMLTLLLPLDALENASKKGAEGWQSDHRDAVNREMARLRTALDDRQARSLADATPLFQARMREARTPAEMRLLSILAQQQFTSVIVEHLQKGEKEPAARLQGELAVLLARMRVRKK